MYNANDLPSPRIPSYDKGVINKIDIDSNNVFVFVFYPTPEVGDTIRVYWDNEDVGGKTLVSAVDLPAIIHIPQEELLSRGKSNHEVSYKVTDVVNNSSSSTITEVYVDPMSEGEKLPAPLCPFADENNCIQIKEVTANQGIPLFISGPPLSPYIGRDLTLVWSGFDSDGYYTTASPLTWLITVTQEVISNSVSRTVPYEVAVLSQNGGGYCYYYIDIDSDRIFSSAIEIHVDNCSDLLFLSSLVSDRYELPADGVTPAALTATVVDSAGTFVAEERVEWSSSGGVLNVPYSMTNAAGEATNIFTTLATGASVIVASTGNSTKNVIINSANSEKLPAPIFTQASAGVINSGRITDDDGALVRVTYPDMKESDVITLIFGGINPNGTINAAAAYSISVSVTSVDMNKNYADFLVPVQFSLAVGDGGTLSVHYMLNNSSGALASPSALVMLTENEDLESLRCYLTTNAAIYSSSTQYLRPRNQGVIVGQPGITVNLVCGPGPLFYETETDAMSITLDENGIGFFSIYSYVTGSTNVDIYQTNIPDNRIATSTQFSDYTLGNGAFLAYNYTTSAPANLLTPCSIYVMINKALYPGITSVRIEVDSQAQIVGYPDTQMADVLVGGDGDAEINIISSVAGIVNATLTLLQNSESQIKCELYFTSYN